MRFLKKYRYLFCFIALLLFSCIMIVRGYLARESAHVQRREDFLLLQELGREGAAARTYQVLIQELPDSSDAVLAADLQRTAMLIDPAKPDVENLVWKYHVSVRNELRRRAERRISTLTSDPGSD